ncbi:MAG TPA: FHA domain-containing protein [Ktedonobacterales bacterium]|nr:FHA domain-containing protein [Ktedonobacterales bacterium]
MAICSHCGRQSQANALNCEFCGFPLASQEDDVSGQDTVYTSPPAAESQDDGQATEVEQQNGGSLAKVVVRPLQDAGEASREYALTGQNISIGRSPSCEIVLENDQLTSRRHALLRYDGAHYTVVDLGSSNGTFVNDTEIRDATPLSHGDRVIVGEHELLFSTSVAGASPIAGVDLNGAPPSSPLASTGEQPAVRADQQDAPQEAVAEANDVSDDGAAADANGADDAYMATVMTQVEPAPAAVADLSNVADVAEAADVSDVADVSDASDVADVSDVADISDISDTAKSPRVSVEQGSVELANGSMPESTPLLARAPSSGSLSQPGGELDQLRAQLAQLAATSEVVAQHAAEETNLSEQRRQALAETRDQLHAILAGIQNASNQTNAEPEDAGDLTDLIALSQQAAADPNHLQNVSRLAEHASDISKALEALQAHRLQPPRPSAEENALAELRALQARLDELA